MRDKPVSAIIVSYNDRTIMARCLDALTAQCVVPGDEIIVVDNGSTDGVLDDLRQRAKESRLSSAARIEAAGAGRHAFSDIPAPRFVLIENGENTGFPAGCNTGFAAAAAGNDIFLLNNDAVLASEALEHLWRALYSAEDIGATGPVSNNALEQCEEGIRRDASPEEALSFGADLSRRWAGRSGSGAHEEAIPYEYRPRLTGFSVLLKRVAADRLASEDGYFLDPRFSPGYFEDEDLGMRLALAGYRQVLCHDAFAYHKGGTGFAAHPEAMMRGRQRFAEKWGFDIWDYIGTLTDHEEALEALEEGRMVRYASVRDLYGERVSEDDAAEHSPIRVLDLYCGMGVNLAHLLYLYPQCSGIGVEPDPVIARIAASVIDVIGEDPEEAMKNARVPGTPEAEVLAPESFDLILAWEACHMAEDGDALRKELMDLLRPDGLLIEEFPDIVEGFREDGTVLYRSTETGSLETDIEEEE